MKLNSFIIETYRKKNEIIPFCVSYSFNNNLHYFYEKNCIISFILFLSKVKEKTVFFSHNFTIDGQFIINELLKTNIKFDTFLFDNEIIYISFKKIILKSSYKFIPYPFLLINNVLKVNKPIFINTSFLNDQELIKENAKNKLLEDLFKNTTILLNVINALNECFYSISSEWYIKNSISSLSFFIFLNFFNNFHVKINLNLENDIIFRKSYFGGRCEIFGNPLKNENLYHFDFKGMFSQVMKENFPLHDYIKIKPSEVKLPGFYYVEIESNLKLPLLPFKKTNSNKLLFPNGHFHGLYWYEELLYFLKNKGKIKKIHYAYVFKEEKPIFKYFVDTMTLKREENFNNNFVFKLINNSLYGRLGLSLLTQKTVILNKMQFLEFKKIKKIISYKIINEFYFVTFEKKTNSNQINSNVMYASIITAKARIKLYNGFKSVIENDGRLLYCDTDSIFAAYKKNVDNETHGEIFWDLSKNDTKLKKAVFVLPKFYAIQFWNNTEIVRIKGVKNDKMTFKKLYNFANKNQNLKLFKTIDLFAQTYDKRIFINNKTETNPLVVNEIYNNDENKEK